ncbi:MAG: hypothetical protein Q4P24_15375, partial [Rhodobacterales bacterium]|nr:hypothetical protein [Rhodobacterales bacterium]
MADLGWISGDSNVTRLISVRLYHDTQIKDFLAASRPFGEWTARINALENRSISTPEEVGYTGADLRRRQIAASYSIEELEQILAPMGEDG